MLLHSAPNCATTGQPILADQRTPDRLICANLRLRRRPRGSYAPVRYRAATIATSKMENVNWKQLTKRRALGVVTLALGLLVALNMK